MSTRRKVSRGNPAPRPRQAPERAWEPLEKAARTPLRAEQVEAIRARAGQDADVLLDELERAEMWKNDTYTVIVTRWSEGELAGQVQELSIRRNDRGAGRDWRDFQRIKNQLAGDEVEAIELYPAMSRIMDTANQYYLFCLPEGQRVPVGFDTGRNLLDVDEAENVGATQRRLPREWVA
jgi:hypothetical protein